MCDLEVYRFEVKINKEMGITQKQSFRIVPRQFIFSVLACGIAVGLYFLLHPYMSMETVSWICVLGAAPCVVFGFVKYHGMTAEQFIWAWIKSEILMPKKLVFRSENLYFDAVEPIIKKYEKESLKKEGLKKNDKNAE